MICCSIFQHFMTKKHPKTTTFCIGRRGIQGTPKGEHPPLGHGAPQGRPPPVGHGAPSQNATVVTTGATILKNRVSGLAVGCRRDDGPQQGSCLKTYSCDT